MGMSATQARYLSLIAQQSNLEYQGQQINQERSVLSQQVSELYNSLLNLQVPTPPSTTEFTKVEYQGSMGATNFRIPISNIKPGKDGKYCVTLEETSYGDSLSLNKGHSMVSEGVVEINARPATVADLNTTGVNLDRTFVLNADGTVRPLEKDEYETKDGKTTIKDATLNVVVVDAEAPDTYPIQGTDEGKRIAGSKCYTIEGARTAGLITEEEYAGFIKAIENSFPETGKNAYKPEDFYTFEDSNGNWHFALKEDVDSKDGTTLTYDYIPNGKFTEYTTSDECQLTFEAGSGRITAIQIPNYDKTTGEILSYTEVALEAVTVTDELAYDEAANQFKYEQYEYDRQQQEINAKTEVIQQQDRNLELKLQRLDTQRQQITTEIDALEKVLKENIESSYKTFSG